MTRGLINDLDYRSKLYGIFSVKWLYLSSLLLFEIGSAICGAALNMNMLIVGRAVAGLGVSQKAIHLPRCLSIFAEPRGHQLGFRHVPRVLELVVAHHVNSSTTAIYCIDWDQYVTKVVLSCTESHAILC